MVTTSITDRPSLVHSGLWGALAARTPSASASARAVRSASSAGAITSIGVSGEAPIPERSRAWSPAFGSPEPPSESASGSPRMIPPATAIRATSTAIPETTAITRWRITARAQPAQWRSARSVRRSRRRSARGPTVASTTGSIVSATATETSGISSPPYAIDCRNGIGSTTAASRPIATVVPLNTTARPEVATAARIASSFESPRSRSSRHRMTTISA